MRSEHLFAMAAFATGVDPSRIPGCDYPCMSSIVTYTVIGLNFGRLSIQAWIYREDIRRCGSDLPR